jgi:hypothetical protein
MLFGVRVFQNMQEFIKTCKNVEKIVQETLCRKTTWVVFQSFSRRGWWVNTIEQSQIRQEKT